MPQAPNPRYLAFALLFALPRGLLVTTPGLRQLNIELASANSLGGVCKITGLWESAFGTNFPIEEE
ncbi:MAG: hypothetical protein EBY17_03035 [Acidobacteriia bacterium]|nr:hypothetical protein [Terriglobia bacterium]